MCISKRIKWIKKKSHREKKNFCIFFQSPHQVDMKNVVECPREFIAYFNALETTCGQFTPLSSFSVPQTRNSTTNTDIARNHISHLRRLADIALNFTGIYSLKVT